VVTQEYINRHQPPRYPLKFKGANKNNDNNYVCRIIHEKIKFTLPAKNKYHAAQLYNACMNYMKIDGWKNDVEDIKLTKKQKEYLKKRYKKIKQERQDEY